MSLFNIMSTHCFYADVFKLSDRKYSALFAIIPVLFLIIEIWKVAEDIRDGGVSKDFSDHIRTLRQIVSIITALFFFLFMAGGIEKYLAVPAENRHLGSRNILMICQGFEGMLLFIVLAVTQFWKYEDGDDIYHSPFFWFAMCFVAGLLSWIILVTNLGGIIGPKQSILKAFREVDDETVIISTKITTIGLFTFWAGYAPAAAKYDDASVVIILLTGFLALAYALKMKEKGWWKPIGLWFVLPIFVIFISWYKSDSTGDTLPYVYLVSLIITGLLYLLLIGGFISESYVEDKDKRREYNQV